MKYLFQGRNYLLFTSAILASILLSWWTSYQAVIVNADAICYLESAKAVGQHSVQFAMQLCGQAQWPFYSLLIFLGHKLTTFDYSTSAYLLDGLFTLLTVVFFITLVKIVGGTGKVLWFAAITILLAHEFNNVREYIIRDHGYWAFYLGSVICLLKYLQTQKRHFAILWFLSLSVASLFRIEGLIFLLVLPFTCIFLPQYAWRQKLRCLIELLLPILMVSTVALFWFISHPSQIYDKLGRLPELMDQVHNAVTLISARLHTMKIALAHTILNADSAREAGTVLSITLLAWFGVSVINNLSYPYAFLVGYAWFKKVLPIGGREKFVLWSYLIINLLITFAFLLERLFLSKRYLMGTSLILMIWVPFALNAIFSQVKTRLHQALLIFLVLGIVMSGIGGIFEFGYSKSYVSEAGLWLEKNVPADAKLYVNDYQLMYYSKHFGDDLFVTADAFIKNTTLNSSWRQYQFLALRSYYKQPKIEMDGRFKEVKVFRNRRGDRITVYQNS